MLALEIISTTLLTTILGSSKKQVEHFDSSPESGKDSLAVSVNIILYFCKKGNKHHSNNVVFHGGAFLIIQKGDDTYEPRLLPLGQN